MRHTLQRYLATPVTASASNPLRSAPAALLPPIPLYRRILRAHRKHLNTEQRLMGDLYVKSEFKLHKNVENPIQIIGFLTEWQMYAQQLEGENWRDEKMDKGKIDKMNDQQLGQLYELMQAIQRQSKKDADGEGEDK